MTLYSIENISEINSEALLAEGFNNAILGMCLQFGQEPVVAYDYEKCLEILEERDEMSRSEAKFNVL